MMEVEVATEVHLYLVSRSVVNWQRPSVVEVEMAKEVR
jgi:hypothetical protein